MYARITHAFKVLDLAFQALTEAMGKGNAAYFELQEQHAQGLREVVVHFVEV
jgi:hypothetical protein